MWTPEISIAHLSDIIHSFFFDVSSKNKFNDSFEIAFNGSDKMKNNDCDNRDSKKAKSTDGIIRLYEAYINASNTFRVKECNNANNELYLSVWQKTPRV